MSILLYRNKKDYYLFIEKNNLSIMQDVVLWIKCACFSGKLDKVVITINAEVYKKLSENQIFNQIKEISQMLHKQLSKKLKLSLVIINCEKIAGDEIFWHSADYRDTIDVLLVDSKKYKERKYDNCLSHLMCLDPEYNSIEHNVLAWNYGFTITSIAESVQNIMRKFSNQSVEKNSDTCLINSTLSRGKNYEQINDIVNGYLQKNKITGSDKSNRFFAILMLSIAMAYMVFATYSFIINSRDISMTSKLLGIDKNLSNNKQSTVLNSYHRKTLWNDFGLYQGNRIHSVLTPWYQKIIQTEFIPELNNYLELNLKSAVNSNERIKISEALKAYLMLVYPQHFNANYMFDYLSKNKREQFDNEQTQYMLGLMSTKQFTSIAQNAGLIAIAQAKLPSIDAQIAKVLQQISKSQGSMNVYTQQQQAYLVSSSPLTVSKLYTSSGYQYFSKNINEIMMQVYNNTWIYQNDNLHATNNMLVKVQQAYIKQYLHAWDVLYDATNIEFFKNLEQTQKVLTNISKLNMLSNISKQTLRLAYIEDKNSDIAEKINSHFQLLFNYINANNQTKMVKSINDLSMLINKINESESTNKAAFSLLQQGEQTGQIKQFANIQTAANFTPKLINKLSMQIMNHTSNALFASAQDYIEFQWQKVFPEINAIIANYYPFNAQSIMDSSTVQWQKLFGDNGVATSFVKQYISGLINLNTGHSNQLYGGQLHLSSNMINAIMQFHSINQNLLASDSLVINFTLKPMYLSNNSKSISLSMLGKNYRYVHGPLITYNFTYPENMMLTNSQLTWIGFNKAPASINTTGIWSWLKLIHQGRIRSINQNKWLVTFSKDGYKSEYTIASQQNIGVLLDSRISSIKISKKI